MTSIGIELEAQKALNIREQFVEILKVWLVIKPLQYVYRSYAENKLQVLKALPKGTVGNDIYKLLNNYNLKVIPMFENHDLKHLVLGYGMTTIEEIRMQAYLFGNGNYSVFCLLFLSSGLLFPSEWPSFYQEFKKGRKSPSILNLSIEDCMREETKSIIEKMSL